MANITTRAGKGAPLSWNEADANFINLNTDKVETSILANYSTTVETDASIAAALAVHIDDAINAHVSSAIGYLPAGTGAVATDVQTKLREFVSVKDFGAVGDGVVDDTAALQAALGAAEGKSLDLLNQNYLISAPLTAAFALPTRVINGSITFSASSSGEFALKVRTTSDFDVENLRINGNNNVAKGLHIHPNAAGCRVTVSKYVGRNFLQSDAVTSVAAGLQISPEVSTDVFASASVSDSVVQDVTSTKTVSPVGRGIYIQGAVSAILDGCLIERIGPYQDGDGVFVVADAADAEICHAIISNSVFVDCAKRSVKSQVVRTLVSNVQCSRTQAFTDNNTGQCEIGIQYGGAVDGVLVTYADGASPRVIVALSYFSGIGVKDVPGTVRNVTIKCQDATDVIPYLVELSINNAAGDLSNPVFENIVCNAFVKNVLFCYSTDSGLAARTVNNLQLYNISFAGFSASGEAAYVFMTRGSTSNFSVSAKLHNVVSRSNAGATVYLDPTPGNTSYLSFTLSEYSNVRLLSGSDASLCTSPLKIYRYFVAENANLTKTFALAGNSAAVRVSVSYTSNRDSAASKLFTEGIVQSAGAKTYYRELIAGVKTDVSSGTIAIAGNASANSFTVSHTAGSLTATGTLLITVEDLGYIQSVS